MSLPFAGLVTFAMVPRYDPTEAPAPHAAILGIPTDEATTQHPGARYGPRAIRDASTQFPYYKRGRGYYDPERDRPMLPALELRDAGDVAIVPTLPEENGRSIAEAVTGLHARGVFPVCYFGVSFLVECIQHDPHVAVRPGTLFLLCHGASTTVPRP